MNPSFSDLPDEIVLVISNFVAVTCEHTNKSKPIYHDVMKSVACLALTNKPNLERLTYTGSETDMNIIGKLTQQYGYPMTQSTADLFHLLSFKRADVILWAAKNDDVRVFNVNFQMEDFVLIQNNKDFFVDVSIIYCDSQNVFETFYGFFSKLRNRTARNFLAGRMMISAILLEKYYFVNKFMEIPVFKTQANYNAVKTLKMAEYLFSNNVSVPKNTPLLQIIDSQDIELLLWYINKGVVVSDGEMLKLIPHTDDKRYVNVFAMLIKEGYMLSPTVASSIFKSRATPQQQCLLMNERVKLKYFGSFFGKTKPITTITTA